MTTKDDWMVEAKSSLDYLCDKKGEIEEAISALQRIIDTDNKELYDQTIDEMLGI